MVSKSHKMQMRHRDYEMEGGSKSSDRPSGDRRGRHARAMTTFLSVDQVSDLAGELRVFAILLAHGNRQRGKGRFL